MKTILIPNYNNKLHCDVFIHIAVDVGKKLLESEMPVRTKVKEKDGELEFVADMIDIARASNLAELSSLLTYASHGISLEDFIEEQKVLFKGLWFETAYAVCVFKKVK